MEKIVRQTLLFDFYGVLLTKHQQDIYEDAVLNDTGYSEIAQREGISRQGVHDLIKRCDRQLEEYEQSLHLLERFLSIKEKAAGLIEECDRAAQSGEMLSPDAVRDAAKQILEEL